MTNSNVHKMSEERARYIRTGWLKINLYNALFGIAIGILICLFMTAAREELVSMRTFLLNVLYSVLISLGVVNAIYISQRVFNLKYDKISFVVVYYCASLIGMEVGTQLARLIHSLTIGFHYTFFNQQDFMFRTLIVFVACTAGYIYHSQKALLNHKLQQKELETMQLTQLKTQADLATLHARINPHFLYNALNSIAGLIHYDPDKAESMTLKLSKLFRYSINQNHEDLVLVKDEVETGNTYLDIEKVRFGDRINFRIEADENLLDAKIPRFLLQPLVENALKHGLKNIAEKGELIVSIKRRENFIELAVADNGAPFPDDLQTGYGLQSTYDKLSLLYGENYQISITNEPVKEVKILIPLKYD